ncbi:MAG TPA: FecR domain-containing protein, partial [Pyrinomonadaceae bacterium]|nr:FecR domain-containing protein [Pyrinomonadaceae bacterium]
MPLLLVFAFPVLGADEDDEYVPDVTARVVRISLLSGDVQVRRGAEEQTWERATLNLPLVEGDELVTGPSARVEVQFDRDSYVRLDENSTLKFTTVRDEGIALSVPQGTISLRVLSFKKSKEFFEIDAPST